MLAACTQDREGGFLMTCVEATAMYSAYAPCMTAIVTQVVTILRSIYPSGQTQDLISNRPPCDFRSDIGYNSWKLNAKNWRNIGRKDISPLALQYVHTVETEGSDLEISMSTI